MMHGGAGWEATVKKVRTVRGVVEAYVEFVVEPGCKLADRPMWLRLDVLQPLG